MPNLSAQERLWFIKILLEKVSEKAGLHPVQPSDCRWLTADILRLTGEQVSETTLKRFYGFAAASYQVSAFTKNILSRYLGLTDWQDFTEVFSEQLPAGDVAEFSLWEQVQQKAAVFSNYSLNALKNRSGIPYEATIDRNFAEINVRYFLESNYPATSFIAPSGYGKTILLCRLIEKYWLGTAALFKNDIVWFINGQTLAGLISQDFDAEIWLRQQMGLTGDVWLRDYFREHPAEVEGRMILVVDGFDELIQKEENIHPFFMRLMKFISSGSQQKWVKFIFSGRTSTWSAIYSEPRRSAFIRQYWYLGSGLRASDLTNIPALEKREIEAVLGLIMPVETRVENLSQEVLVQLENPYYFQLWYQASVISGNARNASPDEYELMTAFINARIFQSRFSSEMIGLIKKFIPNALVNGKIDSIEKDKLLGPHAENYKAYYELLSLGVLEEGSFSKSQRLKKVVYFINIPVFEYFLGMELFPVSLPADFKIFKKISHPFLESRYQLNAYKWFAYRSAYEKRIGAGAGNPLELKLTSDEIVDIIAIVAIQLNKQYIKRGFSSTGSRNKSLKGKVSHLPVPDKSWEAIELVPEGFFSFYCALEYSGKRHEQTLKTFRVLSRNDPERMLLSGTLALLCLWRLDLDEMGAHLEDLRALKPNEHEGFPLNPLVLLQSMYDFSRAGRPDRKVVSQLVFYILQSGLARQTKQNPYRSLLHHIIITLMNMVNDMLVSMEIIRYFYPDHKQGLLSIRYDTVALGYFEHYVHVCLRSRQADSFRLVRLIGLFLERSPVVHRGSYFRIGYEILLAEWSLLESEPEVARIFQRRIQQQCDKENVQFLRLVFERILIHYYREKGMRREELRLMKTLRLAFPAGGFNPLTVLTDKSTA